MLLKVVLVLVCVAAGMSGAPLLSCNYDATRVSGHSSLVTPLQVPLSLPRNNDPRSFVPLHEKNNILLASQSTPNLDIPGLRERMVQIDHAMLEQDNAPTPFFEGKYDEDYHILESKEFEVRLSNPSGIFGICLQEVFTDSESIIKSLRRSLPFCVDPYTKYPLHFNIYVTSVRNRQNIKAAIFLNATIRYNGAKVHNRLWIYEVKFNLLPNHLKLYALQLRNCKQDHNIISIKNPEKNQLQVMVEYRHRKFFMNNQPFDEKASIAPGKNFRFLIEGRNATMTIYTRSPSQPNKQYPALYLPLHCLEPAVIEHIPIGILTSPSMALNFPLLVSSHSIHNIHIHSIDLRSSSFAVELVKMPTNKIIILPNDKHVQVASFVVRSAKNPTYRNSIDITIRYMFSNGTIRGDIYRTLHYSQIYQAVIMGNNRFYNIHKLPNNIEKEMPEAYKLRNFTYTVNNRMSIPIKLERIIFDREAFRQHWNRHVGGGGYIFPLKRKEEFMLEYVGPRQIVVSPARYMATAEFSGGLLIPFEMMVYDNTLICIYQGREDRCSKLKVINFGHHKSQNKNQVQVLTVKNLNPTSIKMSLKPFSPPLRNLKLNINIGRPVPDYPHPVTQEKGVSYVTLKSGHSIDFTFNVQVSSNIVTNMKLILETPFEKINTKLKFHFQEGNLTLSPAIIHIPRYDMQHKGEMTLKSTYHELYCISQIISSCGCLSFDFDQHQEHRIYEKVKIPFLYRPKRQDNVTQACCGEEFIKSRYLLGQNQSQRQIDVELITSSEIESKTKILIQPHHTSLLQLNSSSISQTIMKVQKGSHFCINISNPYSLPLKYLVALLPLTVVSKPNDFLTYFRYAKKEKVDTYFCHKRSQNLNPTTLKQMFKLQQKPSELLFKEGSYTDKNPLQRTNLSNNDYLNGFISNRKQTCYKFTSTLYFKLLIQSQAVNDLLDQYSLHIVEKMIEKELHFVHNGRYTNIQDDFYKMFELDWEKYCNFAVYPIFRFCQLIPLKNVMPTLTKGQGIQSEARIMGVGEHHEQCYMLSGFRGKKVSFQLVIANNHSVYDDYSISLKLEDPKLRVGDIGFELNTSINHGIFIKHYFPDLHLSLDQLTVLQAHGITDRRRIVPLYLTNEDYIDQFGYFKGSRYFQLINDANVDVEFSHYGFDDQENVVMYQGFQLEMLENKNSGRLVVPANSKATFRVGFKIVQLSKINSTNTLFHNSLNLYLYKGPHYHLQLHLVIKIADNTLSKIKAKKEAHSYQNTNGMAYFVINLLSFGFICVIILQLKEEEDEKQSRIEALKQKIKKIPDIGKRKRVNEDDQRKNLFLLPHTSIGTKLQNEEKEKARFVSIAQEELDFFKTLLTVNARQEKSVIISQSSQSEHQQLRYSYESQKIKTDEDEKSQRSQSGSRSQEPKQEEVAGSSYTEEEGEEESESERSENSLAESYLPDGISVSNDEILDIDDDMDFQFGFQKQKSLKLEKQHVTGQYKWFESHNPLKRENDPFPWMNTNEKKKTKHKHRKEE